MPAVADNVSCLKIMQAVAVTANHRVQNSEFQIWWQSSSGVKKEPMDVEVERKIHKV